MKKIFFYSLFGALALACAPEAAAKHRGHYRHGGYDYRDSTRTIYVIENRRPVRRVVYVTPSGRYYRHIGGRRSYITGRYFTSYPSRYYYHDGRPRIGVSLNF